MGSMLRKISILGIALFTTGWSMAQKIDTKSKQILDAVTKNYKTKTNNYFKFVYGVKNNKQQKLQPGIFYSAGDLYKLKIMETEQIFDGKKIYNIDTNNKEVTVAQPDEAASLLSPLSYLETYKKDYNVSYTGIKKSMQVINLKPINNDKIKAVNLYINPKTKAFTEIEQIASDGLSTTIKIEKYVANQKLSSGFFKFDNSKYSNYLITEL